MISFGKKRTSRKESLKKKILQVRGKGKVRKAKAVEVKDLKEYGALEMDSRLALIQALIPIGLMHVEDELKKEVIELAGERYQRNGQVGHDRWGRQQGSVYIQDQRIPIMVPRVRDTVHNREVQLRTYCSESNSSLLNHLRYERKEESRVSEKADIILPSQWQLV